VSVLDALLRPAARTAPAAAGAARRRPPAAEAVDVVAVEDGVIERKDGQHVALVEVEGEGFHFLSDEEQDMRLSAFAQVLNGLPWPVEIVVYTRPVDIDGYLAAMKGVEGEGQGVRAQLASSFRELGEELARDVLAVGVVVAVAAPTAKEAASRARRLSVALEGTGFKHRICDTDDVVQVLLLTYDHPAGLDAADALSGPQAALRARGGALGDNATRLVDILAPSAVVERPAMVELGGTYAQSFMAVAYPGSVSNGWLEPVLRFTHGKTRRRIALHIRPIPQNVALQEVGRQQSNLDLSARWAARQGRRADIYTEEARVDAEELRQDLARGVQRMFDVTLLVTLLADTPEELREAAAELKQEAAGVTLALRETYLEQLPAFRSTAPLGLCLVDRRRPLPTLCVATTFPFTAGELLHPEGHLWGVNLQTGNAVIVDPRRLRQPNMLTVAATGSGKSLAFKTLATQSLLLGYEDVIIIDPSPPVDYERWTAAMGGEYVRFGVGSPDQLNPCEILLPADPRRMEDEDFRRPVSTKVAFLTAIIEAMTFTGEERMPGDVRARLEEPLYRVYQRFGMTDDWRTIVDPDQVSARLRARPSPTLRDVLEEIEATDGLREVALRLRPFVTGTLAMFAGQTSVDTSGPLVVFNVAQLVQSGGEALQTVVYSLIAEHVRQRLLASRQRKLVGIDEAHVLFAREDTARFVSLLSRTARKLGGRTALITQSITDLVGDPRIGVKPAGQHHARVYLGQTGLTLLLRNDKGADVDLIASVYGLSEAQARVIRQATPGRGLLIAGDEKAVIQVVPPDALMPLITTDAGDG
jgi:hypothetical protein